MANLKNHDKNMILNIKASHKYVVSLTYFSKQILEIQLVPGICSGVQ